MKKENFILLVLITVLTASAFATDIIPELGDFAVSKIGADVELTRLYPNTQNTAEKLSQLRQGGRPELITAEWTVGPSPKPISSQLLELQKFHAMANLAASCNAFVRGEVFLLGFNEEMSSKIVTEVSASIVFAEMLRNVREEFRLEYSWKNTDGTTGYGVTFFLAVDKTSLEREITETAKAVSSGNGSDGKRSDTVMKPVDTRKTSEWTNSVSDDLVKSVQTLMEGDSRIQRYREENRQLLGFEN